MNTKKFFKEIKSMGFHAKDFEKSIFIVDSNDFFVAKVSKVSVGEVSTDYPGFTNLEYSSKLNFLDFLLNYATMPIEDREEEEKYYYRLIGFTNFTDDNYLGFGKLSHKIYLVSCYDNNNIKTQFTDKEFEALPKDIKSHNWEKIKVDNGKDE